MLGTVSVRGLLWGCHVWARKRAFSGPVSSQNEGVRVSSHTHLHNVLAQLSQGISTHYTKVCLNIFYLMCFETSPSRDGNTDPAEKCLVSQVCPFSLFE